MYLILPELPEMQWIQRLSTTVRPMYLSTQRDSAAKIKIKEELERYSIIRTVTAVERADIVVVVIDAKEGVTEQDAKIAGIAHDRGKGIIVAVNKWDAIEKNDKTIYQYTNKIRETLAFMPYAEFIFISAATGQRLPKLFDMIDMVRQNQNLSVATGVLNEIMTEAVAMQQPPSDKGKRLKILLHDPGICKAADLCGVLVNDKELMHFSYTRYLENQIRNAFGFKGTSLKFIIRERKEKISNTRGYEKWNASFVWPPVICAASFRPDIFMENFTALIYAVTEAATPAVPMPCVYGKKQVLRFCGRFLKNRDPPALSRGCCLRISRSLCMCICSIRALE